MDRPRMLVVSHVLPFPGSSGQSQRVAYTLRAAMRRFHVTVVTSAPQGEERRVEHGLADFCDAAIVLPSRAGDSAFTRIAQRGAAELYTMGTGLKRSNYVIGHLDFTPERIAPLVKSGEYDCILFEYWHAWRAAKMCREHGVPTVLDSHNVLWRAYERQLADRPAWPSWWRRRKLQKYRAAEEQAWRVFDGLIAINREEDAELRAAASKQDHFYAPMGIDLSAWPYRWSPADPSRIAYYGGLGTAHNQRSAFSCLDEVMPKVWERFPQAEFWAVGSNPPAALKARESDPRVHVTGFVENVSEILATMSAVLCPWAGRYGFRSRVVEVMAAGAPIIVSEDAVAGMDLTIADGIGIANNPADMADGAIALLSSREAATSKSRAARERVEKIYDVSQTYDRLMEELEAWLAGRRHEARRVLA